MGGLRYYEMVYQWSRKRSQELLVSRYTRLPLPFCMVPFLNVCGVARATDQKQSKTRTNHRHHYFQ